MILFIGHEASRTGAPKVLLDFLKWLRSHKPEVAAQILLRKSGERVGDFAQVFPTQVWKLPYPERISLWQGLDNKLFDTFRKNQEKYIRQFENQNVKLIFSNTCTNGELLEQLSYLKVPIITFVHELESVIRIFNQNGAVTRNLQISTHIIVPSEATKNNLVENHQIPPAKISVCYGGVEPDFGKNLTDFEVRKKLNIPENAFVVGSFGTIEPRKSPELFVLLAKKLEKHEDIYFIWVGRFLSDSEKYRFEYQIRTLGLKNIIFAGASDQIANYYQTIDLMLTLSQEDPFPLVNLEAGLLEKPIICFENAGGTPELIEENAGFVVPFLDLEAVAEKILFLKNNPEIRTQMGTNLAQKVKNHFTTEQTMPKIWDIIQKYI